MKFTAFSLWKAFPFTYLITWAATQEEEMPCDFHQTTGLVGIGPWLEIPVKRQCDKMHKYAERAKKIKVRKCLRICIIPDKTPDL